MAADIVMPNMDGLWRRAALLRIVTNPFVLDFALAFRWSGIACVQSGWRQTAELAELPRPFIGGAWPLAGFTWIVFLGERFGADPRPGRGRLRGRRQDVTASVARTSAASSRRRRFMALAIRPRSEPATAAVGAGRGPAAPRGRAAHQRSRPGPRTAPAPPVKAMPSVYHAATKAGEASGQDKE
ncbi:MAG: hypothetical protein JNL87_02885 [Burkholderiaceae bacterium]|nr:hypothetical protein [Burkholderiaceae bacterium]